MSQYAKRLAKWKKLDKRSAIDDIRRSFEEFDEVLRLLPDFRDTETSSSSTLTILGGTPSVQNLPYPFVIAASAQLFPNGVDLLFGSPCRVIGAEIVCDPDAAAASANTTFTIQNASTGATSTGTVTIANGTRRGYTSTINVLFGTGERCYIKAPANLNGVQNLYAIRLNVVPV